jgi:hypothetical protein
MFVLRDVKCIKSPVKALYDQERMMIDVPLLGNYAQDKCHCHQWGFKEDVMDKGMDANHTAKLRFNLVHKITINNYFSI